MDSKNKMMINRLIFILTIGILATACQQKETLESKIVGKWTMEKVYEYDEDVTAKHNPGMTDGSNLKQTGHSLAMVHRLVRI